MLNRNETDNLMSDQWVWDKECAPSEVKLSSNLEAAYFHVDPVDESTGTVGESKSAAAYLHHCFIIE